LNVVRPPSGDETTDLIHEDHERQQFQPFSGSRCDSRGPEVVVLPPKSKIIDEVNIPSWVSFSVVELIEVIYSTL
jgi:hypothetical protein